LQKAEPWEHTWGLYLPETSQGIEILRSASLRRAMRC
jgi:hypothetical protein